MSDKDNIHWTTQLYYINKYYLLGEDSCAI